MTPAPRGSDETRALERAVHDAIGGDFVVLDTSEPGAVKLANYRAAEMLTPRIVERLAVMGYVILPSRGEVTTGEVEGLPGRWFIVDGKPVRPAPSKEEL